MRDKGLVAFFVCLVLFFCFIGYRTISAEKTDSSEPDVGIVTAKAHGFKDLGPLVVEEDGYKLTLSDIFMDENRITLKAEVSGEKVEKLAVKDEVADEKWLSEEEAIWDEPEHGVILRVSLPDFLDSGCSSSYSEGYLTTVAEKSFNRGEVREFLANYPENLNVSAKLENDRDVIYEFKNVKIPLNDDFKLSKVHKINQEISLKHAQINLKELNISPTKMSLDVSFDMEEGYTFEGFENLYLKDDKGNLYKPEGITARTISDTEKQLYFVPSLYYSDFDKLYFCFDGIRVSSEDGREFILNVKDKYPKEITYMGEKIVIKKAEILEKGDRSKLRIIAYTPLDSILKIQGLRVVGEDSSSETFSSYEDVNKGEKVEIRETTMEVSKKDSYKVKIDYPGYLIKDQMEVLLNI